MPEATGLLSVVATPIGNLGDLTPRAAETLRAAEAILCEDTRTTRHLLDHYEIKVPLYPYHDHNERQTADHWAERIARGAHLALVSDAGTPGISDPGFRIVRACRVRGLRVEGIPGACALTTALSISGLPTDSFWFKGFLPPKTAARQRFFEMHRDFPGTICLYESNHRIGKCLHDLAKILGPGRVVCVAKELTKRHETVWTAPVGTLLPRLEDPSAAFRKGEFVLLIAPETYQLVPEEKERRDVDDNPDVFGGN